MVKTIVLTSPEGEKRTMTVDEYVKTKPSEWIYLSTSNKVEYFGEDGELLKVGKSIIYLGKVKRAYLSENGIKY